MTLVIIINALLCLAVLIAIDGWHAWAIVSSHRDAVSARSRAPERRACSQTNHV